MKTSSAQLIGRRELLVKTVPACTMACLGLGRVPGLAGAVTDLPCQEVHKFDETMDRQFTMKELAELANRSFFSFVRTLRREMDDAEVIRLLNMDSEGTGKEQAKRQLAEAPDASFESFVSLFRQLVSSPSLTGEVVEDTDEVLELRVTECILATVFKEADLAGDIGHAAICNMDYYWPPAFNPAFKMERTKTLMQGHDCCNHRYINTAVE
jgi:hypothetical protein